MGYRNLLFARLLAFEFAVEWIRAIRNKAELTAIQKITFITAIADKSTVQIKYLFSSAWLSFLLEWTTQQIKANQQLYLN